MNKVMLYVGLAILLGTLTMVTPLVLLNPEDNIPNDNNILVPPEYEVTAPTPTEPSDQEDFYGEDRMLESGNSSAQTITPEPAQVIPIKPSETIPEPDFESQEPELVVRKEDNSTDLSPVGLMVIPSFLVALGVFIYLRKRIS
jgi:hypothetical protein